ncbi:MAG TPA: hypothetical protein VM425_17425 [Myxococcota bacterium]|nr:hypothetical protein [Myxococcota bacterium]
MRYLYGDLSDFPPQENTLDLLKRFIDMAVNVILLDIEISELLANIKSDRQFLVESIENIDRFHGSLRDTIDAFISGLSTDDVVAVVACGAAGSLDQFIRDGKARLAHQIEQRIERSQGEIAHRSARILDLLKLFYTPSVVPLAGNTLRCALDGQHYQAYSEILDVTGVRCSYFINTAASAFFCEPKKFSDILPGRLDFPVGTKKAWLKKEPVIDTLRIDDAVLTEVVDDDDACSFRLVKRTGNGNDGLHVKVKKGRNGGIVITRTGDGELQTAVPDEVVNPSDSENLLEFYRQLKTHILELYRTRGDLASVSIEETEVVGGRLVGDLIQRLVRYLAPTILEIDARSPAPLELCLKIEHDGGRREEIYIQKEDLVRQIGKLPGSRQALFTPLGINPQPAKPLAIAKSSDGQDVSPTISDSLDDEFDGPATEPNGRAS